MNRLIFAILLLIFPTIQGCLQVEDEHEDSTIRLATTTSLRDSGLLAEILPDFTQQTGVEVDVIAVGSGAAMTLAENDDVDVLIVHDPEREIQFIEDGFAENRTTFAWNRFVLVGHHFFNIKFYSINFYTLFVKIFFCFMEIFR